MYVFEQKIILHRCFVWSNSYIHTRDIIYINIQEFELFQLTETFSFTFASILTVESKSMKALTGLDFRNSIFVRANENPRFKICSELDSSEKVNVIFFYREKTARWRWEKSFFRKLISKNKHLILFFWRLKITGMMIIIIQWEIKWKRQMKKQNSFLIVNFTSSQEHT